MLGPLLRKPFPKKVSREKGTKDPCLVLSASITSDHCCILPSDSKCPPLIHACATQCLQSEHEQGQHLSRGTRPLLCEDGWVSLCRAGGGSFLTTRVMQLSPRENTAAGCSSMPRSHVVCLAAQELNSITARAVAGMLGRQISASPQ